MRLRPHRDMQADPQFPFMVGRLVGAAEAASILLQTKQHDGDLLLIGRYLAEVSAWFVDKPSVASTASPALTARSGDTQIDLAEADTLHE